MAKPLNQKEHNQAFVKFFIFFLITLAMAVSALYFNFQVPKKELAILRERSDLLRNQQINQEKYKRQLSDVMKVFEKLDSSGSKAMIESELRPKLDLLNEAARIDDSTSVTKMNLVITTLVNKYKDAKFSLFDLKDFEQEIAKLKQKNNELDQDLRDCRDRVNFNNQ
jgi:uncharacterized protein YlxW (UPF0749 family)